MRTGSGRKMTLEGTQEKQHEERMSKWKEIRTPSFYDLQPIVPVTIWDNFLYPIEINGKCVSGHSPSNPDQIQD